MVTSQRKTIPGILVGTITMLIVCTLMVLTMPLLITKGFLAGKNILVVVLAIHGISVLIGTLFAGATAIGNKVVVMIESTAIYYLIFICIAMLFYQGISISALYSVIVCVCAVLISIFILNRKNKTGKRISKKQMHR